MYGLIALFFPSVVGIKLLDYLKRGLNLKNTIYYYLIFVLCSNLVSVFLSVYIIGMLSDPFEAINRFPIVFSEYVLISLFINVILCFLTIIIQKNVKLEIVEKKNEKKKKKK